MDLSNYYPHSLNGHLSPLLKDKEFLEELFSCSKRFRKSIIKYCKKNYHNENYSNYIVHIFDAFDSRENYNKWSCGNLTSNRGEVIGKYDYSFPAAFCIWANQKIDLLDVIKPVLTHNNELQQDVNTQVLSESISAFLENVPEEELVRRFRFLIGLNLLNEQNREFVSKFLLANNKYLDISLKTLHDDAVSLAVQDLTTKDKKYKKINDINKPVITQEGEGTRENLTLMSTEIEKLRTILDEVHKLVSSHNQAVFNIQEFFSTAAKVDIMSNKLLKDYNKNIEAAAKDLEAINNSLRSSLSKLKIIFQPVMGYSSSFHYTYNLCMSIGQFMEGDTQSILKPGVFKELDEGVQREFEAYLELKNISGLLELLDRLGGDIIAADIRSLLHSIKLNDENYLQTLRTEKLRLEEVLEIKKNLTTKEYDVLLKSLDIFSHATNIAGINLQSTKKSEFIDIKQVWSSVSDQLSKCMQEDIHQNPDNFYGGMLAVIEENGQADDAVIKLIYLLLKLVETRWPFSSAIRPAMLDHVYRLSNLNPSYASDLVKQCPGIAYALLKQKWIESLSLDSALEIASRKALFDWLEEKGMTIIRWLLWSRCKEEDDKSWSEGGAVLFDYVSHSIEYANRTGKCFNFVKATQFLQEHEDFIKLSSTQDHLYFLLLLLAVAAVAQGYDSFADTIYIVINNLHLNNQAELIEETKAFLSASVEDRIKMLEASSQNKEPGADSNILKPHDYGAAGIAYEIEEEVILSRIRMWIERANRFGNEKDSLLDLAEEIKRFNVVEVIERELRKRAKRPTTLKDNVKRSLTNRSKSRVESLLTWLYNYGQVVQAHTLRQILLRECSKKIQSIAISIFNIVCNTDDVADSTPKWFLYADIQDLTGFGYFPEFTDWLISICAKSSSDVCNAQIAFTQLIESDWLWNEYDANMQIKKLYDLKKFFLIKQIYNCFPNDDNHKILVAALSDTKGNLREGIMKTRQELVSLEEKALRKHLDIDFKKLRELMSAADMANKALTDGDFESSYESLLSAESNLRSFSSSLIETENTIRASLDQLLEQLKERYKEVSIDLPLDQIEILRRIISEITSCRELEIYDMQKIGVLENAFEKALGGSVAEADSILKQDHKTGYLLTRQLNSVTYAA